MYNVAVCDDEPLAARQNEDMACRILAARGMRQDIDFSIQCFSSPEPLLARISGQLDAFCLLLLDIELENENGLVFAARLREMGAACSIIYITAYRDYVFDCFDTCPIYYLLKPVDEKRLAGAIDRDIRENYRPQQVKLMVDGCWRNMSVDDILYAEASMHKSAVHLRAGTVYVSQNFSALAARLEGGRFCRCHFSIIVNLGHVSRLNGSSLVLDNGQELPVSRSRQKEVRKQYIAFIR